MTEDASQPNSRKHREHPPMIKEIAGGVENFTIATDNISAAAEEVRKISEALNNTQK